MKRAVIYIRTATDNPQIAGLQKNACDKFCQENGMQAVATLMDIADTKDPASWVKLREVRQLAYTGQVEAIVVLELSRLAASEDDLATLVREVGDKGVDVYSVFEALSADSLTPLRAEAMIRERERWARVLYRIEQARLKQSVA